jgi:hypothetical protein
VAKSLELKGAFAAGVAIRVTVGVAVGCVVGCPVGAAVAACTVGDGVFTLVLVFGEEKLENAAATTMTSNTTTTIPSKTYRLSRRRGGLGGGANGL